MKKIALSVVTIVTMSSLAFAGGDIAPVVAPVVIDEVSPFYMGLGLSAVSTRNSRTSLDFFSDKNGQDRTGDVSAMVGYDFNPYIALEGRYMTSIFEEDFLNRSSWGIYAKPQYPVTEEFSVYALLGYGGMRANGKGRALVHVNETGFQWGLGVSYAVSDHADVFFDYVNIANDMDTDVFLGSPFAEVDSDALTLGVSYNF